MDTLRECREYRRCLFFGGLRSVLCNKFSTCCSFWKYQTFLCHLKDVAVLIQREMGAWVALIMVASMIATAASDENGVIHIGGKVLCQDCTQGWNEWIDGKPIKGSKVSVTCLDERSRVVHYASDLTDDAGQFDIPISKYIYGKKLNPRFCSVRLVSSPDAACNVLTDFAGGKSGVRLRGPSLVYRDLIKYVLGPFYFTSPMCEQPEYDESDENNGSNY